jgi:hypothetical protein
LDTFNLLQERAYMALLKTMSQPKDLPLPEVEELQEPKPRNQFHAQILDQANQPPVAHKFWETQSRPVEPCRGYDWPDNAI